MLPTPQIKTTAALALALVALTPAAASASRPIDPGSATPTAPYENSVVRVITPTSGFDWGDAGIGAAGGLALSMLALGGTLAVSQRRTLHPNSAPTPTS